MAARCSLTKLDGRVSLTTSAAACAVATAASAAAAVATAMAMAWRWSGVTPAEARTVFWSPICWLSSACEAFRNSHLLLSFFCNRHSFEKTILFIEKACKRNRRQVTKMEATTYLLFILRFLIFSPLLASTFCILSRRPECPFDSAQPGTSPLLPHQKKLGRIYINTNKEELNAKAKLESIGAELRV